MKSRGVLIPLAALALTAALLSACGSNANTGGSTTQPAAPAPAGPKAPSELTEAELLEKAKQEGTVVWYTAVDVKVAEAVAKAFEAKYAGVKVQVERAGSERVYQRIGQEYQANIKAVDVINSSDASHFIVWKRDGWLAKHVPPDVKQHFSPEHQDKDGYFAVWRASLSPIGINTNLVKPEEAPKSFKDLLDPKWKGKIVKAHPSYSGTVVTATFQITGALGWGYMEALSKQAVMQQQSSTAPPKTLASGERAVMADGNEYNMFIEKEQNHSPVAIIYPEEGTPFITSPSAVLKDAPHPHAARLFQNYIFTVESQELNIAVGGLRSVHPQAKEKAGRTPLKDIKLLKDDAEAMEKQVEEIKTKYTQFFGT